MLRSEGCCVCVCINLYAWWLAGWNMAEFSWLLLTPVWAPTDSPPPLHLSGGAASAPVATENTAVSKTHICACYCICGICQGNLTGNRGMGCWTDNGAFSPLLMPTVSTANVIIFRPRPRTAIAIVSDQINPAGMNQIKSGQGGAADGPGPSTTKFYSRSTAVCVF